MDRNNTSFVAKLELETILGELKNLHADVAHCQSRIARFLTEAAFREFPTLKEMNANQIREFGALVNSTAMDFAWQVSVLAYHAKEAVSPSATRA